MPDAPVPFKPFEFTPFMLSGSEETIAMHFAGRLPVPGDVVELVCYEVSDRAVKLAWRVVGETATRPNPPVAI